MNGEGLADDFPHPHPRIQRGIGILKDKLHPTSQRPKLALRERREVLRIEVD